MRPVINTEKHYVQLSLATIASGAILKFAIALADAVPTLSVHVREGAIISAVYIEMWIQTDDAALGSSIVTLEKVPGAGISMTTAESALLNDYDNKKNVLHTQMGLTPNNVTYPMASVKGWFKIPKGKQRFGLADQLNLNIHAQSNGLNVCGFAIFKEQY